MKFYHVLFLTDNIHSAALVVCGRQYFLDNIFHASALPSHPVLDVIIYLHNLFSEIQMFSV